MVGEPRSGLPSRLVGTAGDVGLALYAVGGCALAVALVSLGALLAHQPLVFPGLGPTAPLFFEHPLQRAASPRHTVLGHLVALGTGYASLLLTGLVGSPGVLDGGATPARVVAAALSVAMTGGVLVLLRAQHPPAARRLSRSASVCCSDPRSC